MTNKSPYVTSSYDMGGLMRPAKLLKLLSASHVSYESHDFWQPCLKKHTAKALYKFSLILKKDMTHMTHMTEY